MTPTPPLRVRSTRRRLNELLHQAGVRGRRTTVAPVWAAFKGFCSEPVACAMESLLIAWGIDSLTGQPQFTLTCTRQFMDPDGSLRQLYCDLLHAPSLVLAPLGQETVWSDEFYPSEGDWLTEVENRREFFASFEEDPVFRTLFEVPDWTYTVVLTWV